MTTRKERLLNLCREDGDCLIWTGSCSTKGHPMLGKHTAKRALWTASRGPLAKNEVIVSTCGNVMCLAHLAKKTKSSVAAEVMARPDVKARKIAANLRTRDSNPLAKINMAIARDMRALKGVKTRQEIAEQFGVSVGLVKKVQLNEAWKEAEFNPFAGLFTGLMAANQPQRSIAA